MPNRIILKTLLAVLLAGVTGNAAAAIIVVEPDDFADGTDISHAFAGITLSTVGGNGGGAVVAREDGSRATTGSRTFGNFHVGGQVPERLWFDGGPALRVDFDAATRFVAIDAVNQDNVDFGILQAFDVNGVLRSAGRVGGFEPEAAAGENGADAAAAPASISRAPRG